MAATPFFLRIRIAIAHSNASKTNERMIHPAKIHFDISNLMAGSSWEDHLLNARRFTAVYVSAAYPAREINMPINIEK